MNWLTSKLAWIGLLVLLALPAGFCFYQKSQLPKQEARLETTLAIDTAKFALDTTNTDSVMAKDSAKKSTIVAVHKERKSAVKALGTSQKQVKNLSNQLKAGKVVVFGEGNYEFPNQGALSNGSINAKLGLMIRVAPGTYIQGFVQQPITGVGQRSYNVGIRKEIKLF